MAAVNNPEYPVEIDRVDLSGSINRFVKRDEYIYVSTNSSFTILRQDDVGIKDNNYLNPKELSNCANYPNPFNDRTIIKYELPQAAVVTIDIYDILGRRVESLLSQCQPAGSHSLIWNAEDLSSGMYFYRIQAGDYNETRKMLLLK